MKKFLLAGLFLIAAVSVDLLHSETGWENSVRPAVGGSVQTRVVSVSSSAATTILPADVFRPDATCFNNSAFTLWIGSAAATTTLSTVGFPILSSATFRLGSMTGVVSGLADAAAGGAIDVRCFDGKTP